jgi:hypothetical protein
MEVVVSAVLEVCGNTRKAAEMSSSTDESFVEQSPAGDREQSSVVNWRISQLQSLGFEPGEAFQLALSQLDLDQARRLVGQGCPLELVVRICF